MLRDYREVAFMSVAELAQGLGPQALERLNRLDDLAAERGFLFPAAKTRRHR